MTRFARPWKTASLLGLVLASALVAVGCKPAEPATPAPPITPPKPAAPPAPKPVWQPAPDAAAPAPAAPAPAEPKPVAPAPEPASPVAKPKPAPAPAKPASPAAKPKPRPAEDELVRLARTDPIALLARGLAHTTKSYKDYTCMLIKQERLAGGLTKEQTMRCKHLVEPFSVFMAWTKNAGPADRVLYVKGRYGGKMLAHPSGLPGVLIKTVARDPAGKDARKNSLRTIDQFGFANSLANLLEFYRKGKAAGVLKTEYAGTAKVGGRQCLVLVRYLPEDPKWPAQKTTTYLDREWLVPLGVLGYDAKGGLICSYRFHNVKFNTGLTEKDFLPESNQLVTPKK